MVKDEPNLDSYRGFEKVIERLVDFNGTEIPCIGGGSTDQELEEKSRDIEARIKKYME
jgi:hypothetical protein